MYPVCESSSANLECWILRDHGPAILETERRICGEPPKAEQFAYLVARVAFNQMRLHGVNWTGRAHPTFVRGLPEISTDLRSSRG